MQIKHRWTDKVLFEGDFASMKLCVEGAARARANLAWANLAQANLVGANLAGANLAQANLAGANLAGAYLAGANLAGANLAGAYLDGANLDGANLAGAYLDGAYLDGANLAGANLARANLAGAYLARANLAGAKIREEITLTGRPLRRAIRDDGYEFYLWPTDAGFFVQAGCRWFTFDEAWAHWCGPEASRLNTPLGDESHDILVMFSLALDRAEAV